MESKLAGQTDSHCDYSAHLLGGAEFRYQVFKILFLIITIYIFFKLT